MLRTKNAVTKVAGSAFDPDKRGSSTAAITNSAPKTPSQAAAERTPERIRAANGATTDHITTALEAANPPSATCRSSGRRMKHDTLTVRNSTASPWSGYC